MSQKFASFSDQCTLFCCYDALSKCKSGAQVLDFDDFLSSTLIRCSSVSPYVARQIKKRRANDGRVVVYENRILSSHFHFQV